MLACYCDSYMSLLPPSSTCNVAVLPDMLPLLIMTLNVLVYDIVPHNIHHGLCSAVSRPTPKQSRLSQLPLCVPESWQRCIVYLSIYQHALPHSGVIFSVHAAFQQTQLCVIINIGYVFPFELWCLGCKTTLVHMLLLGQ